MKIEKRWTPIARNILIRVETGLVEDMTEGGIALPKETTNKQKGGMQVHTVLAVGATAFDDCEPEERERVVAGVMIVTDRYPGAGLDFDPNSTDVEAAKYRVILDNEVRLAEDEDGVYV